MGPDRTAAARHRRPAVTDLLYQRDAYLATFEATVRSKLGRVRVYDAFVLRDGQITHHFTGVMGA